MGKEMQESNLFKPITIGEVTLSHRVVHAPTSRSRSTGDGSHIPTDLMLQYYDSRSKHAGTLIIFESCLVSPDGGLVPYKSGVWNQEQCRALKVITDQIHANGSFVSCQIFAPGRVANIKEMKEKGLLYSAPSVIFHAQSHKVESEKLQYPLCELSIDQIARIEDDFVQAAANCLDLAGFDFIELHGSSGFLIEQFLSPISNTRNDQYGGSLENRCRFLFEIIDKLIRKLGSLSKVGIRLSAWSEHFGMIYPKGVYDVHPPLLFCQYVLDHLEKLKRQGYEIGYVSLTEPRVSGNNDQDPKDNSNQSLVDRWSGKLIRAGGYASNYKSNTATATANANTCLQQDVNADDRTLIAFSRPFTSNPDLITRLKNDLKLDNYQREFFYSHSLQGYLTFGDYVDDTEGSNSLPYSEDELQREGTPLV
ncbi:uncharacterized protein LODBEIA_P10640 [Lodderomyces beijingensis]|uniref:NADH:flavin oxidoreductase/NADH oxidase N-terminal domain-containing protein n=1 Tax=Lodderomyces beijingensis TaxID=1775926 RepID=A0ABP0ZKN9_9ASCO